MSTIGQTFRVFLSSTFSDFILERTYLYDHAWPEIRRYCEDRGVRFQIIDLRWGISEEASQDQRTIAMCLEEVRRCQEVSPDFSFIALLGDRYGTRMLPDAIPAADFEIMRKALSRTEQQELGQWYRLDENALPVGAYVLLPRGGAHPVANGKYANFTQWELKQAALLALLTRTCQATDVSAQTRIQILCSVTEQEIESGIFSAPDKGAGSLCFRRTIPPRFWHRKQITRNYHEVSSWGRQRLASLMDRLSALPNGLIPFTASSTLRGLSSDHLDGFCNLVKERVKARIDEVLTRQREHKDESATQTHKRFAAERMRHFTGRSEDLATIVGYLDVPATAPLFVTGPGGVGKTALMLKALEHAEADVVRAHPGTLVLHRFIGGSAAVNEFSALIRDLCSTLAKHYGKEDVTLPARREDLVRQFPTFLALATEDRPLVLFLDAVDQLGDAQEDLAWLSPTLPAHVHLIVSTIIDAGGAAWQTIYPSVPVLYLGPLDHDALAGTLTGLLTEAGRTLQPEQRDYVLACGVVSGLPLYLRLAAQEAQAWHSWQVGADLPNLAADIHGVIEARFEQLEAPASHGTMLVDHAMGLLGAAKDGLAEDELLDVLSHDEITRDAIVQRSPHTPKVDQVPLFLWSRLYFDQEALLTEREQDGARLIGFYHRQVGEVVRERYLKGKQGQDRHAELAQCFEGKALVTETGVSNLRKLAEQPFQEASATQWEALRTTLTDVSFLELQIRRAGVSALLADLDLTRDDATLREIARAVRAGTVVLGRAPNEIWNQVQGRVGLGGMLHASVQHVTPRLDLQFPSLIADEAVLQIFEGHTGDVQDCVFSPDGRLILSASNDKTLRLWRVATGQEMRVLEGHASGVTSCVFSPNRRLILSASDDKTLRLWEAATGQEMRTFEGHTGRVQDCAFSPDGQFVLSASTDRTSRLWAVATGNEVRSFKHGYDVTACAFSPDGQLILSGDGWGKLRLWEVASGEMVRAFEGEHGDVEDRPGGVTECAFSPDGQFALSSSWDFTVRLWKVATGQAMRVFQGTMSIRTGCAFSPDGQFVLSSCGLGTLQLWEVATGQTVQVFEGRTASVSSCAFSPDGQCVLGGLDDGSLRLWQVSSGQKVQMYERHSSGVTGCAYSRDGQFVVSSSGDRTLRLWEAATGQTVQVFEGHTNVVWDCAFSPDGQSVLSASDDRTVRLWAVATGQTVRILQGHLDAVNGCAFYPFGKLALSSSWDRTLRLWTLDDGWTERVFEGHGMAVNGCAFSPDGHFVLSSSTDQTLRLWEVYTGWEMQVFRGHRGPVWDCAFSPDGQSVLSASDDKTVRLWEVASGKEVRVFQGHTQAVHDCAFSPDGRFALSSSSDQTLRLWDITTGQELTHWTHDIVVNRCAFHPAGNEVVVGDYFGGVHFLKLVL